MSNPSRFDIQQKQLLSGYAGNYFENKCLLPNANRLMCDILTLDQYSPTLTPGTKGLLLLGEAALRKFTNATATLDKQRGSPFYINGIPALASYLPQDCCDFIDHESRLNPQAQETLDFTLPKDEEDEKEHSKTQRKNWKFWLAKDTAKIYRILKDESGKLLPSSRSNYLVKIYPAPEEVIKILSTTQGQELTLDIETDCELNLTCFGFAFDKSLIYVVPVHRYDYTLAYEKTTLCKILRALAVAMSRNTIVCHNANFDLLVLAHKYKLPFGKNIYDTMISSHRAYPEIEKSLGHCISLYLYEPYHKDEGVFMPRTREEEQKLWSYNAKDVRTTMLVRAAIQDYAKGVPGLLDSIKQGNDSIRPYIINSLLGIKVDERKILSMYSENSRRLTQLLRIMQVLIGKPFLPSNKQAKEYLVDELGYKILKRSKKTGKPSVDEGVLIKYRLAHPENVVLSVIMKYRTILKETGSLKFTPLQGTINYGQA